MTNYREILKLKSLGINNSQIADSILAGVYGRFRADIERQVPSPTRQQDFT
jgi:hypothetical protein